MLLLALGLFVQAQFKSSSNLITKKIAATGTVVLSDKSLVPQSIFITNFDASFYTINTITATLTWIKPTNADSTLVSFRTFSFAFKAEVKRLNYDSVKNNYISQPFIFNKNNKGTAQGGIFDFGTMNYNGSFGRSLSFGNNQDAVFNSQLNLQISGMLGDSIEVAAAITDNNIPIQADGTTQQLNEFDRILLQFKKKNWQINLGDIDVRQNQNYFLNFYKRLQGASYSLQSNFKNGSNNKLLFAGAIAKGKFTRNIFQGQEGNQGPYRLKGNNNELFLIILSGTEKVFIDGEIKQRGEDQDYIINYNTGEITFTPKVMITKDKRIQVEFEYADRNYLNSLLFVSNEMQFSNRLKLTVAAYSNVDAKNSTINQNLDTKQKQFLSNLGDSVGNAFYKIAALDTFSIAKILYVKRVNPINLLLDSIYVYSITRDSTLYNLNFIDVGANKGDYINFFNAANGKVYQYIAPVNGIKQGNFEAATFLVTPKKQQIITFSAQYSLDRKTILNSDIGFSNYDINTFSTKDKGNNNGYAAKFLLQRNDKLKRDIQLNSTVGYEWVDKKYTPVERLRTVEFFRDWGLLILPNLATEHLPKANIEFRNIATNAMLRYGINGYIRDDNFSAVKNSLEYNDSKGLGGLQYVTFASYVSNKSLLNKGNFAKVNLDISKIFSKLKNLQFGTTYLLEHNEQRNIISDTITPLSFAFENIGFYIKTDVAKSNRLSINYFTRSDKLPLQKNLVMVDKSQNYNVTAELLKNPKHQFRFNITYRELAVKNSLLTNLVPDKSLLGRTEYIINEWNGFITGNTLYELGAGQEQRRDFSYIEVPAGRGEYAWIDYNTDGIPQLNEFEVALFSDQAKYIRVFTPTNQFIKANYTQFNYNININPRALTDKIKSKVFKNFITRFNLQSSMQTGKKVLAKGNPTFNPFKGNINDTALINLNNIFSNTISFNRFSSSWSMDVSNIRSYSKALLTYGFENRELTEYVLRGRVNFKRQYTLELIQKFGNNNLVTPKFANRNFDLQTNSIEPKLTYTYLTKFRIQTSYFIGNKQNASIYGGEKSTNKSFNLESKLNAVNNTSLLAKFTYSNITFNSMANTTVSYIMLDGLVPGKNFLWNVEFTKRLGNNLELSFSYEGRKPGDTKTINIGRASLRALL